MKSFRAALWAEWLKARRSRVTLLTSAGFGLLPLVGGLFMIILKDPEQARSLGLLGAKARLTAGTADWPAFLTFLTLGTSVAGPMLHAIIAAWVFGREFSDHTAKEFLALPTSRATVIAAKFVLLLLWTLLLSVLVFAFGLAIGWAVDIPGWSVELAVTSFAAVMGSCLLALMLLPWVAFIASAGRGYLPPIGWAFLTLALAQIAAILGLGDWFPWAIPALFSGSLGPRADHLALHSYVAQSITLLAGLSATFAWWQTADQSR